MGRLRFVRCYAFALGSYMSLRGQRTIKICRSLVVLYIKHTGSITPSMDIVLYWVNINNSFDERPSCVSSMAIPLHRKVGHVAPFEYIILLLPALSGPLSLLIL